jgi:hypothetical protein
MKKEKLTQKDIEAVLFDIRYKDWTFEVGQMDEGYFLKVRFTADGAEQYGRKWYLSPFMVKGEIVQTALKAVMTAEEHETRERFTYKSLAIFGPHFDVERLVEMALLKNALEKRA